MGESWIIGERTVGSRIEVGVGRAGEEVVWGHACGMVRSPRSVKVEACSV